MARTDQSLNDSIELALTSATRRSLDLTDNDTSSDSEVDNKNEVNFEEAVPDQLADDEFLDLCIVNEDLLDDGRGLTVEELLGEDAHCVSNPHRRGMSDDGRSASPY